jgi:hypothetical protein
MPNQNDDFYLQVAQQRALQIEAEKQATLADLAAFSASGDAESAAKSVQALANLESERTNLLNLHQQYIASQNPPEAPPQTHEEWQAKPVERMTAEEGLEVMRQSRDGKDLDRNNPDVRRGFIEAKNRRASGE